jgi:lysine 2,3-aminomutase
MNPTQKFSKPLTRIEQLTSMSPREKAELKPVTDRFVFRVNEYYQSLIDWNDPDDPIRRIVIPHVRELDEFGELDASNEAGYTVVKGLEHKYKDTALLLVNNVCGAYCRFCFRKRLFTDENDEVIYDVTEAIDYIRRHPEINNVLLSGGDPLLMATGKLEKILQQISAIDHVRVIRIGTKMAAFDPYRIVNDPSLLEVLSKYSAPPKKIYIMNHFNHPRELTEVAINALKLLQKAGVATVNQSPIIRGVNDQSAVISELFNTLSFIGVLPYYLFICRPTAGNEPFVVPIERCLELFEGARLSLSGLAKQARLCMSHRTGKVEVVGKIGKRVVFRYHRAADPRNLGRILVFDSDATACWLDDYLSKQEDQNVSASFAAVSS